MGFVFDDASPGSPFERRREGAALELAEVLARHCVELLGPELVAVILHGSLVLGDFDPMTSDVDLLVITAHALDDGARRVLADSVLATDRGDVAGLDFRVVTRDAAAKPVADPPLELYVGVHHDASEIEMTRCEPDLLVEFSVARDHGLSLVGPGAAAVIGAVPSAWVLNYGDSVLER